MTLEAPSPSLPHGTSHLTARETATSCPKSSPSWLTYPNPSCPNRISKSSTSVKYTSKSSLSQTLQQVQEKKSITTSGKDTGHPASPLSPSPIKSDHPQPVGKSGARLSTSYSQTQSGPPKSSHNIASIVGTQKPPLISFGPSSLILPPPYSTLDLRITTPSEFTPIEIASATIPLLHTLHFLEDVYQLQSHIGSHLW